MTAPADSYAITWSPSGTTYDPQTKYNEHIYDVFIKWRRALVFAMYPELNHNGNIHYHGIITVLDKIAWYKRLLPQMKRKGFVVIKKMGTPAKWMEYITKDKTINETLFTPYPLTKEQLPKNTKQKPTPDLDYSTGILKWIGDLKSPKEENNSLNSLKK